MKHGVELYVTLLIKFFATQSCVWWKPATQTGHRQALVTCWVANKPLPECLVADLGSCCRCGRYR